jgi:hypothetical protein
MKKEIFGILVCMLLIAATVLSVATSVNISKTQSEETDENEITDLALPPMWSFFNRDWNCWEKKPNMFAIPSGNVAIGIKDWSNAKLYVWGEGEDLNGVEGKTDAIDKSGVYGWSDIGVGVTGRCNGDNHGVFGATFSENKEHAGIFGKNNGEGAGIYGEALGNQGTGVTAIARGGLGIGVSAEGQFGGVFGKAVGSIGIGVTGIAEGIMGIGVSAEGQMVGIRATATGEGGYSAEFTGNVLVKNKGGDPIIELGEGLDYAEGFDVSKNVKIESGMVMVIDVNNPGKLTISTQPYDKKVAGIITGANGLGSGVRLCSDLFDCDIALAGRVYCNVDATNERVEPGDLLTTSGIQGYAMKVTDYNRAQGAILGKAMETLEKGEKSQILVLVTLQ